MNTSTSNTENQTPSPFLSGAITVWGQDMPFSSYTTRSWKLKDITTHAGNVSIKFFSEPIYIRVDGVIRADKPHYGKYMMSITDEQMLFVRRLESEILSLHNVLATYAEPTFVLENAKFISPTFKDTLLSAKVTSKTKGMNSSDGKVVTDDHESLLTRGTSLIGTYAIVGVFHGPESYGMVANMHSYLLNK